MPPTPPQAASSLVQTAERWVRARRDCGALATLGIAPALAARVAALGLDAEAQAAAWVVGAGLSASPAELEAAVGPEVTGLVQTVRRVACVRWRRLEEEQAETLRKAFVAMARDVRGVILSVALRLEQLSADIERADAARKGSPAQASPAYDPQLTAMARESLDVHATLANRLGVWRLKWPLEDLSFKAIEPQMYARLQALVSDSRQRREAAVARLEAELVARLRAEQLSAHVTGRPKHLYSVYRKMQRKQVSFEQIYDLTAVRVITPRLQDCYAVLGLVHGLWRPIPGELDDYIASPKPNGYQSLHTAVIGPEGRAVEIQIRTEEMHRLAEYGVAAHWAYKEGRTTEALSARFSLLRRMMEMGPTWSEPTAPQRPKLPPAAEAASAEGPAEATALSAQAPAPAAPSEGESLAEAMRTLLFDDAVFVFTPKGDVIELPEGSTPLDFAYRVHTEVGHRCRGARVNDQIASLTSRLKTGDRVDILTHREPAPSRDWMRASAGFLHSARARAKVRTWFREHEALFGAEPRTERAAAASPTLEPSSPGRGPRGGGSERLHEEPGSPPGIVLDSIDDILGQRAQCCRPMPGDDVVGFITRGRGLTLHRSDCPQMGAIREPERLVRVDWGGLRPGGTQAATLVVRLKHGPQSLAQLVGSCARSGAQVVSVSELGATATDQSFRVALRLEEALPLARLCQSLEAEACVLSVAPAPGGS